MNWIWTVWKISRDKVDVMDRDWDEEEFDLEAIEARQEALEAELAREEERAAQPEESAEEPEKAAGEPKKTAEEPEKAAEEPTADPETDWEAAVEAVLFTMGRPVELRQLAAAIDQDTETAKSVVENLARRYESENRGMEVIRLEDSYQLCTRGRFYENLIRVASAPKRHVLTDVTLETLSIIAYKQPVTRMEIEKIRGVNSDHAVNRLVEYELVEEVGRLDAPGRPALFATTEEFLRRFGIGSRENLPDMDPVRAEEIRSEVEEELQIDIDELKEPGTEENGSEEAGISELGTAGSR